MTKVLATDLDREIPNDEISYYIQSGAGSFRVNGSTGNVTIDLNAKFQWEIKNEYELVIIASDKGTPSKTGTTTLYVDITDVNNLNPSFTRETFVASCSENAPSGTYVTSCPATDKDEDPNLLYTITNINAIDRHGNAVNNSVIEV